MKFLWNNPRWLLLGLFAAMWAGSYFAALGLDHLQAHDPQKIPPNLFDGRYDGVIFTLIPFMIVGGLGTCVSALWCLFRCLQGLFSHPRSGMTC